ncbi:MAG: cupin-like domain-containing protein [Acidiferrobacterales bacterium]|nr:cupin-like domain-containing protein [Acidiferrobacterales bacterium]
MFDKISHTTVTRKPSLPPAQFIEEYKNTATPVVLTDVTKDWVATKEWDLDYLAKVAGDNIVPVYSSKPAMGKDHQHAAAMKLPLRDYVQRLKEGENDLRMFFYNILKYAPVLLKDFTYPKMGLKLFDKLPVLFVGGSGTKVQTHYDIDLADLLLCHFGGRKHVLLVPPEQTKYMYRVPYSFSALHSIDLADPDYETYPALKKLSPYVAVLEHGDALYIPSGYWHYIIYEDTGFSMTLRAMPTRFSQRMTLLKNIFFTRIVEGLMRKSQGQKWVDRNERLAIENTNRILAEEDRSNQ